MLHGQGGYVPLEYVQYPDGMSLVKWTGDINGARYILLRPKSMQAFTTAMYLVDGMAARGMPIPELFLPCAPGARQDRLNDSGDFLFTAASVARDINARNFPRVTLLDPHSDVITALIDRCRVIGPDVQWSPDITDRLGTAPAYRGVIAPDAGSEKRAGKAAKYLGLPVFHAWKTRDVTTGAISGFGTEPLERGHYLVVDDLCDAGGTFIGLAKQLKAQRCTADLYVTHGLFTKGTADLLGHFTNIFCTDSTLDSKPGITVFNVCEYFLKTIR